MLRALVLGSLAVLLAAAPAQAQRGGRQGDTAIVVGISGLYDLRISPALGGIGLRYFVGHRTAVGAAVGFGYRLDDSRLDTETGQINVAVWGEQHVGRGRGAVSPFVAGGVQVGAESSTLTDERLVDPCQPTDSCLGRYTVTTEQSSVLLGVGGALGAEVRLVRGVTLGGAYTLGITVADSDFESRTEENVLPGQRDERRSISVGTSVSRVYLSVYF